MSVIPRPVAQGDEAISVPSLQEAVYARLRSAIMERRISPGRIKLRELAETYGVSTMPIREALRRLEADGVVRFHGRKVEVVSLGIEQMREILALREHLEILVGRLVIASATREDIAKLRDQIRELESTRDPKKWRRLNRRFHATLHEIAGNPRLTKMLNTLVDALEPYVNALARNEDYGRAFEASHRGMIDAIEKKDADAYERMTKEHWGTSREMIERILGGHGASDDR